MALYHFQNVISCLQSKHELSVSAREDSQIWRDSKMPYMTVVSNAKFTLQDSIPDFPLVDSFWSLQTKVPRPEANRHCLALDRYVWTFQRRNPRALRCLADAWKISSRLNIRSCQRRVGEPCNKLQPMRAGTGWGQGGERSNNLYRSFVLRTSILDEIKSCPVRVISRVISRMCFLDKTYADSSGIPPG